MSRWVLLAGITLLGLSAMSLLAGVAAIARQRPSAQELAR